jgi:hypothetical protein
MSFSSQLSQTEAVRKFLTRESGIGLIRGATRGIAGLLVKATDAIG